MPFGSATVKSAAGFRRFHFGRNLSLHFHSTDDGLSTERSLRHPIATAAVGFHSISKLAAG